MRKNHIFFATGPNMIKGLDTILRHQFGDVSRRGAQQKRCYWHTSQPEQLQFRVAGCWFESLGCRLLPPFFQVSLFRFFFSSFPNFRMLNLEKQLAVDKKLLPRNVLRVLRVAGKLKLGKKERPSLHPMPWRRAVISSRHGNLTPAMRLSSEAMYPAWLWLTVRHGLSMAHRNRWFTELKNDDFPCLC